MNNFIEGEVTLNEKGRWQICDHELDLGSNASIRIGFKWIEGIIDFCLLKGRYIFWTKRSGIPMWLNQGMVGRVNTNI